MARLRHSGEAESEDVTAIPRRRAPHSGSRLIVVLDTGGVEGLAPMDEIRRARLRLLRERADDLVMPAAVLAESVLTGHPVHDFHVQRLLELLDITDVDVAMGHAAGALRRAAIAGGEDPPPSGVDTLVVAAADARAADDDVLIVTSDGGDFELLGSLATHGDRLGVLVV
jgi:hypothetical protein